MFCSGIVEGYVCQVEGVILSIGSHIERCSQPGHVVCSQECHGLHGDADLLVDGRYLARDQSEKGIRSHVLRLWGVGARQLLHQGLRQCQLL